MDLYDILVFVAQQLQVRGYAGGFFIGIIDLIGSFGVFELTGGGGS